MKAAQNWRQDDDNARRHYPRVFEIINDIFSPDEIIDLPKGHPLQYEGVDFIIKRNGKKDIHIDAKILKNDPSRFGTDSICLESRATKDDLGWLDPAKKSSCDLILWFYISTSRWLLLPFEEIRRHYNSGENRINFALKYRNHGQCHQYYTSYCCFVPTEEFMTEPKFKKCYEQSAKRQGGFNHA